MIGLLLQETSSRVQEVLFNQLLMGIFPVVFYWERWILWIRTFPYFWNGSMEAYVCTCISSLYISNYLLHFSQIKCYWSFLFGYRAFVDFSLILAPL